MEHIMTDLETLGKRAGCQILSIGAVGFGPDGLGPEFYMVFEVESQEKLGLFKEQDTVDWWAKQSRDARRVFTEPKVEFSEGLKAFSNWALQMTTIGKIKMWGNGSDFDNAILYAAYAAAQVKLPWLFWNSRCYRTLKALCPGVPVTRTGTHHHALDDAKTQALHAIELLNARELSWS